MAQGRGPHPAGGDPSEGSEQAGTSSRDDRQTREALPARTTQTAVTLPRLRADPQGPCAFRFFMLTPGLTHTTAQRGRPPSSAAQRNQQRRRRNRTYLKIPGSSQRQPSIGGFSVDFTVLGLPPPVRAVTQGHCPHLGVCACTSVVHPMVCVHTSVCPVTLGKPFTPWCVHSVVQQPGDTVHAVACVQTRPQCRAGHACG